MPKWYEDVQPIDTSKEQVDKVLQQYRNTIENAKNWNKTHRDQIRRSQHKRYEANSEEMRYRHYLWRLANPEKINSYMRKYRMKNSDKINAEQSARKYTSLNQKCSDCGTKNNLERHHPDYSKPLEVVTLCRKCHRKTHRLPLGKN